MNAELITAAEHTASVNFCVYTAAEAAARLGVSETSIRRAARKLGVKKITGPTVTGFIKFFDSRVPVALPYHA